ncbi:MAG: response regulator [Alphaproteobacteria bacterium]|nr:response regulator [Alphaproteobacteria bacterium]
METFENKINPIDNFIGQKLRAYRSKLGWTLNDLAEKLEVSYQQVHKYEQGQTKIPASSLYRLSKIFSASPNCFFEGFNPDAHPNALQEDSDTIKFQDTKKISILLVEDDSSDEFLFRKALEESEHPYNLFTLHDGEQALEFLRRKRILTGFPRPDIVVLDLSLPKMNGHSLLRAIKQDREIQDIPVIILTSSLSKKDMMNVYRNYASGYICKSFDFKTFKKNILIALHYWTQVVALPYLN